MITKTRAERREERGSSGWVKRTLAEGLAVLSIATAGCATSDTRRTVALESREQISESSVMLAPAEGDGSKVRATVVVFGAGDFGNATSRDFVNELEQDCGRAEPDHVYGCVCGRSADLTPGINLRALRNAAVTFEYFEPGEGSGGNWRAVPGCERVLADRSPADSEIQSSVAPEDVPYYAECDISAVSGERVYIRATFTPPEGQSVAASASNYEFIRR